MCTEVKHASTAALWASACRFTARRSNRWDPAAGSDAGPSSCGEAPPLFPLLPLHCWFSLHPGSPSKSFSSDALIKGFRISALLFVPPPRTWAPPTGGGGGGQTTIKEEREKRLQHANNVNWKPLLLSYLRFFFFFKRGLPLCGVDISTSMKPGKKPPVLIIWLWLCLLSLSLFWLCLTKGKALFFIFFFLTTEHRQHCDCGSCNFDIERSHFISIWKELEEKC